MMNEKDLRYFKWGMYGICLEIIIILLTLQVSAITISGNTLVNNDTIPVDIVDFTDTTPFIVAGQNTIFHFAFVNSSYSSVEDVNGTLKIDSIPYNLTYNTILDTYDVELFFNYSDIGDYTFQVSGVKPYYSINNLSGELFVRNFTELTFNLYKEANSSKRFDQDMTYLFLVPHNRTRAESISDLAYPFEFIEDVIYTKSNRWAFFPEKERIYSSNRGFHKLLNTDRPTSLAFPKGEPFSVYLLRGNDLKFESTFYGRYYYDSLSINTYLISDRPTEATTYDLVVTSFDSNPFVTVVRLTLWVIAILFILVIPSYIALQEGRPREALAVLGALAVIVPIITFFINSVIGWIFL